MSKSAKFLVVTFFVLMSAPAAANNGTARSCAGIIGSFDGGGLVAQIIRFSGAAWWVEQFARARPCG